MSSNLKQICNSPGSAHDQGAARDEAMARAVYGLTLVGVMIFLPTLAFAYIGPGAGLAAISTAMSLIGAIFLGIVGLIWYPIKRVLKALRGTKKSAE